MKPAAKSASTVKRWLEANDIDVHRTSTYGDHYHVRMSVRKASVLLQTDFEAFEHEETGRVVTRSLTYSLPEHVRRHINYVDGVIR